MKIKAELLQLEKRVDSLRAREDDAALQRSRAVAGKQSWYEQTATCHVYSTHQERPCRGRVEAHGTVRYSTEAVTMMSNHDGGYE